MIWSGPRYQAGGPVPLVVEAARAGDPRLASPRVIKLFVTENASNQTEFPTETGTNLSPVGLSAPGSCLLYDPTGSQLNVNVETALDTREVVGTNALGVDTVNNFFSLYPGVSYDFRPGTFSKLFLRATSLYTIGASNRVFIGNLIVSSSLIAQTAGSTSAQAIYSRLPPSGVMFGTDTQGVVAGVISDWIVNPGGTGKFINKWNFPGSAFRALVPTNLPLGINNTSFASVKLTLKNLGPGALFVSGNTTLTSDGTASQDNQVYRLDVSDPATSWLLSPPPNTPFSPSSAVNLSNFTVYSGTPGASLSWSFEFQF